MVTILAVIPLAVALALWTSPAFVFLAESAVGISSPVGVRFLVEQCTKFPAESFIHSRSTRGSKELTYKAAGCIKTKV
jgi:hypothetical protein